eukprot:TRINITY_DN2380_c0_g1_i2.p1 TRINITY_DN2380_c0_g1~~TRINITY_DN2380_c0_g1_i2.p1  ORF type:complete len:185 (+),score=32.10 TRINITY_DN2380_c0_g1_i2:260-814(+)
MIRSDCTTFGYSSDNVSEPSSFRAQVFASLTDHSVNPGINTFVSRSHLAATPECWIGDSVGTNPLPATFLRDVDAIFAGFEDTPEYGRCEKWSWFMGPQSLITFYFDAFGTFARWDQVWYDRNGPQGPVGVVTKYRDLRVIAPSEFEATVFSGSGVCPPGSVVLKQPNELFMAAFQPLKTSLEI